MNIFEILFTNNGRLGYNLKIENPKIVFNRLLISAVVGFLLSLCLTSVVIFAINHVKLDLSGKLFGVAVILITGTVLSISALLAIMSGSCIKEAVRVKSDMAEDNCKHMLKLCNAYPEVKSYRDEVIKQGRKFTESEYLSLVEYTQAKETQRKIAEQKTACKELYLS